MVPDKIIDIFVNFYVWIPVVDGCSWKVQLVYKLVT